ncbi:unnamed protein product [Oncorhynchus mykiss]|uniref:TRAPPC10 Ig-like domain-containing protein n=1 Tax=Oncorhynchus mykiss TaxID=8022 RepID=A0A060Z410_ONCMY|nr:unnamed protein product [Oncorhynchus mykiss]
MLPCNALPSVTSLFHLPLPPLVSPDQTVALSMAAFAQLRQMQFSPPGAVVHVGAALQLELRVCCLMPVAMQVEQLAATLHFSLEQGGARGRAGSAQRRTGQGPQGQGDGVVLFPQGSPLAGAGMGALLPPALELYEMQDRSPSDSSLTSTGVVCKNMHLLLRRHDSSASLDTPTAGALPAAVAVDDGAQMLRARDITLQPGDNSILFTAPTGEPGSYTLRQLCGSVGRVQFVQSHIYPVVQYEVYSQEPQLTIEPLSDNLLAGIPQKVKFTIATGHYSVKKGDALQLSNTDSMPILHSSCCSATVLSSTGERMGESALSIQSSEKVTSISLPPTPPYHTLEFQLEVLCHIPPTPFKPDIERLTNGEVRHRPKSHSHADSGMINIDQKV